MNLEDATIKALEGKLIETEIKDTFKVKPKLNLTNSRKILDCLNKAIEALEPIWEMQSGNYYGDLTLNIGDKFNEKADDVVDGLYDMKNFILDTLKNIEGDLINK